MLATSVVRYVRVVHCADCILSYSQKMQKQVSTEGLEPSIAKLGAWRRIHWATRITVVSMVDSTINVPVMHRNYLRASNDTVTGTKESTEPAPHGASV